jgi:hypothetical protein
MHNLGAFTHPPWYYQTARTVQQGLNYDFAAVNWDGVKGTPETEYGIKYEEVEFVGPENATLRGWHIAPSSPSSLGIVAVHGYLLNICSFTFQKC